MRTLLTTVIPTYNGARFLAETLSSLLAQTNRPDRVVVVDDGSTDGTRAVAESFHGLRCRWVAGCHVGSLANHNRGLALADVTDYLHFLHQDDVLHPQFYEAAMYACWKTGDGDRGLAYTDPAPFRSKAPAWRPWTGTFATWDADRFVRSRARLEPTNPSSVLLRTAGKPSPCAFRGEFVQVGDQVFLAEWAARCRLAVELPPGMCGYRLNPDGDTAHNVRDRTGAWAGGELRAMDFMSRLLPAGRASRAAVKLAVGLRFAARAAGKVRDHRRLAAAVAWHTARALATGGR